MYLKYSRDRSRNPVSTPLAESPAARRKAPDGGSEFGIDLIDPDLPVDTIKLYTPYTYDGKNPRIQARRAVSEYFTDILSVTEALNRTPKWFRTSHFPLIDIPGRISGKS